MNAAADFVDGSVPIPSVMERISLRLSGVEDLDSLAPLWTRLYEHQTLNGMQVAVPPDGFAQWAKGVRPLLGRFVHVWRAEKERQPIGFLCGRERVLPGYFGGGSVGFISDVFVDENCRGLGVGRRLLAAATELFRARGIKRIELQVIAGNPSARRLYLELGWHDELVQMVRILD